MSSVVHRDGINACWVRLSRIFLFRKRFFIYLKNNDNSLERVNAAQRNSTKSMM